VDDLDKKTLLVIGFMIILASFSALFLLGLYSNLQANMVITSINNEVLNFGGKSNQVFTGYVVNNGNIVATNVRVIVTMLDMNNKVYEKYTDLGSVEPGESKPFSVVFPFNDLVMVSYYTHKVTFD